MTTPYRDNWSPGSPAPRRRPQGGDGQRPDAQRASAMADTHVRTLIHELSSLLDGSLRYLRLAKQDLAAMPLGEMHGDDARRHLEAADHALGHMAELIRAVSDPFNALMDENADQGPVAALDRPRPLVEAVSHAVEVLRPLAEDRGVSISVEIGERLNGAPPAPIFPIVSNALRNAIESIGAQGGRIEVLADADGPTAGMYDIRIDVLDDGEGPVASSQHRVFEPGFTTKSGNAGLGLALCRDIVLDLNGTIELAARWPERPARRGARLSVRYRAERDGPAIIGGTP